MNSSLKMNDWKRVKRIQKKEALASSLHNAQPIVSLGCFKLITGIFFTYFHFVNTTSFCIQYKIFAIHTTVTQ